MKSNSCHSVPKTTKLGNVTGLLVGSAFCALAFLAPALGQEEKPAPRPIPKKAEKADEKKAKAIPAKTKAGKQAKRKVTRRELMQKPGTPRPRAERFYEGRLLEYRKPTKSQLDEFSDMRRNKRSANARLIDHVAKSRVYRLTDPANAARVSAMVEEVLKEIRTARSGTGQISTAFIQAYKQALTKYGKDLLDNSLIVRVNALYLLRELFEEPSEGVVNVGEPVAVLLSVLKDNEQPECCHYMAMKGIDRAKEVGRVTVQSEAEIVEAMMAVVSGADVQELLLDKGAVTFGNLGRAFRGNVPERAEVGTFLANLAVDSKRDLRTRYEAAVALGKLNIPRDIDKWNFELQAVILAHAMHDVVEAMQDDLDKQEVLRWRVFHLGDALARCAQQSASDANVGSLLRTVGPLIQAVLDDESFDLGPLQTWIADHQAPQNRRLAPRAAEVVFPKPEEATAQNTNEPSK